MKTISIKESDRETLIFVDKICAIEIHDDGYLQLFMVDGSKIGANMTKKEILEKLEVARKDNLKNIFSA
jgi:hypothetical protein